MKRTTYKTIRTLRLSRDEADFIAAEEKQVARWRGEPCFSKIMRDALALYRISRHQKVQKPRALALK